MAKAWIGEYQGIRIVMDDDIPAGEFRVVPAHVGDDPFPKLGEPDRMQVTPNGVTRYRTLTAEQAKAEYGYSPSTEAAPPPDEWWFGQKKPARQQ